jgi:hypothetical protein
MNLKAAAGCGRGLVLRFCSGVCMEGLRKTTKNLNQDSRSPVPRFEPGTSRIRNRSVNRSTTTFGQIQLSFRNETEFLRFCSYT